LKPLIDAGLVEMTIPHKPQSSSKNTGSLKRVGRCFKERRHRVRGSRECQYIKNVPPIPTERERKKIGFVNEAAAAYGKRKGGGSEKAGLRRKHMKSWTSLRW